MMIKNMIKNNFITENYCNLGDMKQLQNKFHMFKSMYFLRAVFLKNASIGLSNVI